MEPDKVATIAALAVALVALSVASAQAIQQYFVSGQLIRLCDSVVYNRMPGQGHRIWQFSQFRFRVVYSIPQVRLLPELWLSTAAHIQSLPSHAARLPQLSVDKSKTCLSALAGEASWVSFIRAVQYSSGESLRYTMIEGDADRCPSDLPVVPMQLSLRDVVVVATMAGMECTDVSFPAQSISMQGSAGTITSSRHPVLGALIHFAPKQSFEDHGIRTLDGRIHSAWVARMLDVMSVAGHRLDLRDRKHFEEDEGTWIVASSDRAPIQDKNSVQLGTSASSSALRQRRIAKHPSSVKSDDQEWARVQQNLLTKVSRNSLTTRMDTSVTRRPQDGHWLFSSVFHESSSSNNYQQQVSTGPAARTDLSTRSLHKSTTIADQLRRFFTTARFQKRPDILPISEPEHETKTEYLNSQSGGTVLHIVQSHKLEGHEREAVLGKDTAQVPGKPDVKKPRYRDPLLDRTSKEYAGNNAIMYEESQHISEVGKGDDLSQLMLTNSGEYRRQSGAISVPVSSSTETNEALHNKARTEFVVNKWRQTFRKRRNERSRECSQHGAERRLVLRQRSVHTNRRKSSVEEHLHRKRQESSRYLKLGTIQSQPKRSGRQDTHRLRRGVGSRPKHRSRVRSNHRRRDAQREQSRYQRSPAGSKSDLYSSCSSDPKDVAIGRDHKENIPYTGLSKNRSRRYGVGSQEKLDSIQRGRRRNSSLARNASRDISVPQGQKKVQVVRPEADVEDPRPREPWPRKGQDNVPQDIRPALRTPTERFPEDPVPVRPRVASVERYRPGEIPKNARCTKIDRKLVNPEALELGRELFEERVGYVIVLRVLTRAEIEQYAIMTQQIRSRRAHADTDFRFGGNESTEDRSSEDSFKDDSYSSAKTPLDEAAKSIRKHDYSGIGSDKASGDNNSASVSSGLEGSGDEVDDSRADTMDDGNADFDIEKNHTHLPHNPSFHPKSPSSGQRSTSNAGTGEPKQRPDVTRRRFSVSRQRTLEHDEILTYDEEILFLHSENILKQLKNCTNQCKDTTTTIQLCFSAQPNLGHDAREICEATKECNTLLKAFLTIVEPLRDNKKIAEVVVADLGILLHGVRASLDIIERGFAHSDITLMDSGSRKTAWKHTIDSFEKKYLCSMLENLVLAHRFGTEVLSNLKLGILKSPESALLKKRLAQASGYKDLSSSPESPNLELYRIQNNYESAGDESNSSASSLTTWESNGTGEVSWFWISQTDVLPGYCATPWKSLFSDAVCVGAISIFLKTIEKFTNKSNFRYIASHDYCKEWLRLGRTTYPSYAHAANGGVVAAGVYEKTTIGAFESAIAPLELLRSYDFQVDRSYYPSARAVVENTAELMGLDSWLSICGRTSEIVDGSSHLLQNLPTLIQQIMMDVDLEFSSIDRASRDGGSRIIKTISGSLLQYLKEQQLSKAEQLFALVALLRTAKMALCIVRGTDTAQLHDVLVHDMQVYLA